MGENKYTLTAAYFLSFYYIIIMTYYNDLTKYLQKINEKAFLTDV